MYLEIDQTMFMLKNKNLYCTMLVSCS